MEGGGTDEKGGPGKGGGSGPPDPPPLWTRLCPVLLIKNNIPNSIYLHETNVDEIAQIINSLKNTSAGWDNIHAKIVKSSFNSYIEPLIHIFNLSFHQGVVPSELKVSKITPLFKSGNDRLINNYRPVSVLPTYSKIFERLMYDRLYSFIDKHNILYKYQYGFRSGYSTNTALITLIDKLMNALDKGEFVLGVFLDFSKAFDTINIDILLHKLSKLGIRGTVLQWFKKYFDNRKQFVTFNNVHSNMLSVTCGVPQGSILGPILFLLYINESEAQSYNGLKSILITVSNLLLLIMFTQICYLLLVVFHKVLYWDLYYFYFTLMTYQMYQLYYFHYYLLMIPIFS